MSFCVTHVDTLLLCQMNIMAGVVTLRIIQSFLLLRFLRLSVCTNEDPSLFPGHLEPLGARHKKTPVKTLFAFPEPRDLFENFASSSQLPVLIKGGAKLSPALSTWTDDYFMSVPGSGNFSIDVEIGKKENRTKGVLRMSFKQFVERYRDQDVYMVNRVPVFLQ